MEQPWVFKCGDEGAVIPLVSTPTYNPAMPPLRVLVGNHYLLSVYLGVLETEGGRKFFPIAKTQGSMQIHIVSANVIIIK